MRLFGIRLVLLCDSTRELETLGWLNEVIIENSIDFLSKSICYYVFVIRQWPHQSQLIYRETNYSLSNCNNSHIAGYYSKRFSLLFWWSCFHKQEIKKKREGLLMASECEIIWTSDEMRLLTISCIIELLFHWFNNVEYCLGCKQAEPNIAWFKVSLMK